MALFYDIDVELIGKDGNAFAIIGAVTKAMRQAGLAPHIIDQYREQAMSGDYDHLLKVTSEWVNIT